MAGRASGLKKEKKEDELEKEISEMKRKYSVASQKQKPEDYVNARKAQQRAQKLAPEEQKAVEESAIRVREKVVIPVFIAGIEAEAKKLKIKLEPYV